MTLDDQLNRRDFIRLAVGVAAGVSAGPLLTHASEDNGLEEKIIKIGNTTVSLRLLQKKGSCITYFNMHDNENAGVEAARQVIAKYGGRLIELRHKGVRNISFDLDGKRYEFDPNRMFSDEGIVTTLKERSRFSKDALLAIEGFRETVLDTYRLRDSKALVTVHNNINNGDLTIDFFRYRRPVKGQDADNFILVTDPNHYEALKKTPYNLAIVKADNDKGSMLPFWANDVERPYINVEAQHGHIQQQKDMIKAVLNLYRKEKDFLVPSKERAHSGQDKEPHKKYIVQDSDNTWNIVQNEYGKVNWDMIGKLVEYNKAFDNVFNPRSISPGQKILLPPASALKGL